MGLLSGLEKFGFRSLDKVEVYAEEKKKEEEKSAKKAITELTEPEMLFEKTYECPVCEKELKVKTLKQGKAKLMGTDIDLRATYQNIDPLKYGAIICKNCGYAALTNYFNTVSDPQIRLIKENISANYTPSGNTNAEIYSYDDALEIHKMALLNAVVKRAKASEKAYICLKSAWLLRGKAELLENEKPDAKEEIAAVYESEQEYLNEAYKGFVTAMETETTSTICGMDGSTLTYLCAALAFKTGAYEDAQKMLSRVMVMSGANRRIKDKCTDLKELIAKKAR